MARVIERRGTDTSTGFIVHDDVPSTHEHAEQLAGRRLDRRRNYAIVNGEVCESVEWTACCSGCGSADPEYGRERGFGCDECGFTGRRRQAFWVPLLAADASREVEAELEEYERERKAVGS